MNVLPRGWAASTLGELGEVVSGSTPRTTEAAYWGGDIAWVTPDDLSRSRCKTIAHGARNITQAGYDSCSTRLVPAGTVLYTSRAPIGYVSIAAGPVCTNQGFKSFVPSVALISDYLYWFLVHATPAIRELGSGTTFPELSKPAAKTIPIPVPPLNEQRRIVAAIEEQLSRLDAADESLRCARERVAILRHAVYSTACAGDWPMEPLHKLLREQLRNGHSAKASKGGAVRTLTLTAVTRESFTEKNTKLTSAASMKVKDLWLEPGDILVERSNTPELVGTAALYNGPLHWAIFPDLVIRVRVGEKIRPEFLAIVLKSERARRYFRSSAQGIAGSMPKIDQGVVERFVLPLPPLDEQTRIVEDVVRRISVIEVIETAISRARKRSLALRRSILERAFRGDLVPQDPNDEPASVLLERIAAERVMAPKATGRRPRPRATMTGS